jgi:hypothetical protein
MVLLVLQQNTISPESDAFFNRACLATSILRKQGAKFIKLATGTFIKLFCGIQHTTSVRFSYAKVYQVSTYGTLLILRLLCISKYFCI